MSIGVEIFHQPGHPFDWSVYWREYGKVIEREMQPTFEAAWERMLEIKAQFDTKEAARE
jgi:hypothetical protein